MATATTSIEAESVFDRMKVGRDYWAGRDRERYLRNPSLSPMELGRAKTDEELRVEAEQEVTARREYAASAAGEFISSIGKAEFLVMQIGAALSDVRAGRDRADGKVTDDVLAKLDAYKALIGQLSAEAIMMGVFAAQSQPQEAA